MAGEEAVVVVADTAVVTGADMVTEAVTRGVVLASSAVEEEAGSAEIGEVTGEEGAVALAAIEGVEAVASEVIEGVETAGSAATGEAVVALEVTAAETGEVDMVRGGSRAWSSRRLFLGR